MSVRERIREYRSSTITPNGNCKSVSLPPGLDDADFPSDFGTELVPELREIDGETVLAFRPRRRE